MKRMNATSFRLVVESVFFSLLTKLKENRSEKTSTILEPRLSSGLSGEKDGKIPNSLLFELIR